MSSQVLSPQASHALDAWVRLLRGHASATRSLSAQLQAKHGLTINDYEVLLLLSRADGGLMRRVDLAHATLLTPSGVTRLLEGLERAGYVEKTTCPTDARVTYAVLTDAGTRKLREASRAHVAEVRALFEESYTPKELETLARLLGRLPGVADALGEDCSPAS